MTIRVRSTACVSLALFAALCVFGAGAQAANREVKVLNKTKVVMTKLYASAVGTKNWEEDLLEGDFVKPKGSVDVDLDEGNGKCRYDFKAVFKDGESAELGDVNVCKVETIEFTE